MSAYTTVPRHQAETTVRDGYTRLKDVYIPTRDGSVLCANIHLPIAEGGESAEFPMLLTLGPYGKDVRFSELGKPHTDIYANMAKDISPLGSDACFETPDPIIWSKEYGYALVRVDVRGSGGSPGVLDPFGINRSAEIGADSEGQDAYDAIGWAGTQAWSNGKVAMCGISYFGMACYWGAMQQPPYLAAIVPYEALADLYGHCLRQGGRYGKLEGFDEEELAKARFDYCGLESRWVWRSEGAWPVFDRTRSVPKIMVPILSAGNWMDPEIHLPGNLVAFEESSSMWKCLEMHTRNHLADYYQPHQLERQRKSLDHFLLDKKDNGLNKAARIELLITKRSLRGHPEIRGDKLSFDPYTPSSQDDTITYPGLTGSSEFRTDPFTEPFEILGYPYLELTVSTNVKDMDIFIYFYIVDPRGEKLVFRGNHDEPAVSFLRSWFRLSHRTLSDKSAAHRPILDQRSPAPVRANERYEVNVPIPPTSMIIPKDHKLAVSLRANDEEMIIPLMRHVEADRSEIVFGGTNRIVYGGRLVLPVVERGS